MLTTRPWPDSRSAGSSAWVTRTRPSTFTSYIRAQSVRSASATPAASNAPPALFTSTSSRGPTAFASAATEAASVTSQATAKPPISSARAVIRSSRRAAQTTRKPSPASARAVAAPIPLLAPVTTAVRSLMRPSVGRRNRGRIPGVSPEATNSARVKEGVA